MELVKCYTDDQLKSLIHNNNKIQGGGDSITEENIKNCIEMLTDKPESLLDNLNIEFMSEKFKDLIIISSKESSSKSINDITTDILEQVSEDRKYDVDVDEEIKNITDISNKITNLSNNIKNMDDYVIIDNIINHLIFNDNFNETTIKDILINLTDLNINDVENNKNYDMLRTAQSVYGGNIKKVVNIIINIIVVIIILLIIYLLYLIVAKLIGIKELCLMNDCKYKLDLYESSYKLP